jgi:hypothetical protein
VPSGTAARSSVHRHCDGRPHICDWRDNAPAVAEVIAGYANHLSLQALAGIHRCTPALISKILEAHGVARRRGRPRSGLASSAAASPGGPKKCRPCAHACRWGEQGLAVDQVLAEYLVGSSMAAIGRWHGRAAGTVARLLDLHGVRRRSQVEQAARRPTDLGSGARRPPGPVVAALAAEHGVSDRWVRAVLRGSRLPVPTPGT